MVRFHWLTLYFSGGFAEAAKLTGSEDPMPKEVPTWTCEPAAANLVTTAEGGGGGGGRGRRFCPPRPKEAPTCTGSGSESGRTRAKTVGGGGGRRRGGGVAVAAAAAGGASVGLNMPPNET